MAQRHDMDIVITKNGEVHIKVKGISGTRCLDITKDIEAELGEVLDREKTSEYYKEVNESEIKINKQG